MKHSLLILAVLSLAPLATPHAADQPIRKIGSTAVVGRTQPAQATAAGISFQNPVDDVLFSRRSKAAWRDIFSRRGALTRTDLEKAMNPRAPLGLAPLPIARGTLSDSELQQRIRSATLALFVISERDHATVHEGELATAFLVQTNVAVTCFHTFSGLGDSFAAVAMTETGETAKVEEILAVYPLEDLAFLRVTGAGNDFLPLRTDAPAGLRVKVVGHPVNNFFYTTEGTIGRYAYKSGSRFDKFVRMHLTIDSTAGFSGGALVDSAGNALGMLDSFASYSTGDTKYQVPSAIPAATILARFTQPYDGTMSPDAVAALLQPKSPQGGRAVVINSIETRSVKGLAVAQVRSDDPRNFEIMIEDASGKRIAQGKPTAELRQSLPDWALELYDANVRDAEATVRSIVGPSVPPATNSAPTGSPQPNK